MKKDYKVNYPGPRMPWLYDIPKFLIPPGKQAVPRYTIEESYSLSPASFVWDSDTKRMRCWTDIVWGDMKPHEKYAQPTPGFWEILHAKLDTGLRHHGPERLKRVIGGMAQYAAAKGGADVLDTLRDMLELVKQKEAEL